jgi:hypothetical protein
MRHIKLVLAAATLLAGSVSMLRAESIMALASANVSAVSPSPVVAVFGDSAAPQTEPLPSVVEAAASGATDQPLEPQADLGPSVSRPDVVPVRPIAHRPRAHSSCAHRYHRPARAAKSAGPAHLAALRSALWRGAPRLAQPIQSWSVVLLGVGY